MLCTHSPWCLFDTVKLKNVRWENNLNTRSRNAQHYSGVFYLFSFVLFLFLFFYFYWSIFVATCKCNDTFFVVKCATVRFQQNIVVWCMNIHRTCNSTICLCVRALLVNVRVCIGFHRTLCIELVVFFGMPSKSIFKSSKIKKCDKFVSVFFVHSLQPSPSIFLSSFLLSVFSDSFDKGAKKLKKSFCFSLSIETCPGAYCIQCKLTRIEFNQRSILSN